MKTMKMKLFAVMALVGVLSLAGTAAADHLTKSPGTWKLVSAERDGKALPKEDIEHTTLTVTKGEGDALKIAVKDHDKVVTEGTAKVHKSGDKHDQYDMTYSKGTDKDGKDLKGKTVHGLIAVDGDTMKVHWHGEKDHPKEFTEGKDYHGTVRTYKRVK